MSGTYYVSYVGVDVIGPDAVDFRPGKSHLGSPYAVDENSRLSHRNCNTLGLQPPPEKVVGVGFRGLTTF